MVLLFCVAVSSATDGKQNLSRLISRMPFTYLLDTSSPSSSVLSSEQLARKVGWDIVPEDKLTHKFSGDIVLLNDQITVVLRRSGSGAKVYTKTDKSMGSIRHTWQCLGMA